MKQPNSPLVDASIRGAVLERRPVTHLSYSGDSTHGECPKRYELSYITGAPRKGAVWFVGGKAVHRATEEWDRAEHSRQKIDLPAAWKRIFNEELDQARRDDPAEGAWHKAGTSKDNPEGESAAVWYSTLGPAQVESYIAWRKRMPYTIWETPDGRPAIELDVCGPMPGMGEVEFKGFIDRVFVNRFTQALAVVDIKTGSRKPDSPLQFGVYAAAVKERYGVTVPEGAAFLTRRGILTEPWDLTKYTPEYIGRRFAGLYAAIQAGHFAPRMGHHCVLCGVKTACYAQDGPLAARYDPDALQSAPY